MKTRGRFVLLAVLLPAIYSQTAAETPNSDREWTKKEHLILKGNAVFSTQEIVKKLYACDAVHRAMADAVVPEEYANYLCKMLVEGYRFAGFAEATVTAGVDRETATILIQIHEGKRFRCGEIRLQGNKKIASKDIIRALTGPTPPAGTIAKTTTGADGKVTTVWLNWDGKPCPPNKPQWTPGEIGRTGKRMIESLENAVITILRNMSYYQATCSVQLVPDGNRAVIDLVIQIQEGDQGDDHVGEILVASQNTKSSWRDIVDYLGVRRGVAVTDEDRVRLEHRLLQSGRFSKCSVNRHYCGGDKPFGLTISVTGYEKAPLLGSPLSPAEQTMLALRRWLGQPEQWREDVVLSFPVPAATCEAILSPTRGVLWWQGRESENGHSVNVDRAMVVRNKTIAGYDGTARTKLIVPLPQQSVKATANLSLTNDPKTPFEIKFGIGLVGGEEVAQSRTIQTEVLLHPSAAIALLYEHNAKCAMDNGVLSITEKDSRWWIDAATGRLLHAVWRSEGRDVLRVAFHSGIYDQRLREIENAGASYRNIYDQAATKESIPKFFTDLVLKDWLEAKEAESMRQTVEGVLSLFFTLTITEKKSGNSRMTDDSPAFEIPYQYPPNWRDEL